ncbi:phosphotriesterase-related protein [Nocardioides immobilis]|uniref:Phosphotriesterase-related protein n=1 Tax=Nocardioides immobilis TaxID=2049295 RepID=A0A417Y117_9ACTN|nr:phosphotriesterase-related protein [Nocardioides immobilis]
MPTLTGDIDPSELGRTLMHEHVIMLGSGGVIREWPALFDRDAAIATSIERMAQLAASGVDSLVEMTTFDLGRDIEATAEVARASSVNIIACTGVWLAAPPMMKRYSASQIADAFVGDIVDGISGTDLRAGIIKVATDETVDDLNRLLLSAAAEAHRRTGTPIGTHSNAPAGSGARQQDVLEEFGVDLSRVLIGHCSDTSDLDYLRGLMQRGSYIGIDRFGLDRIPSTGEDLLSTAERVAVIADLCRDGFANRIVLSHDANCVHMGIVHRDAVDEALPNWHHLHIQEEVLPALLDAGVTQADIDTMLVDNPRTFFAQATPY